MDIHYQMRFTGHEGQSSSLMHAVKKSVHYQPFNFCYIKSFNQGTFSCLYSLKVSFIIMLCTFTCIINENAIDFKSSHANRICMLRAF